jgi:hypothetical protein
VWLLFLLIGGIMFFEPCSREGVKAALEEMLPGLPITCHKVNLVNLYNRPFTFGITVSIITNDNQELYFAFDLPSCSMGEVTEYGNKRVASKIACTIKEKVDMAGDKGYGKGYKFSSERVPRRYNE